MGKNAKLGIAAGVVLVLALLCYVTMGPLVGIGIIVVGALGVVALLQRLPDDEDDGGAPAKRSKGGKSKLDTALEARQGGGAEKTATPPRTGGGLPTWNPTALDTWQPPSLSDREEDAPAEPANQWDSWDNWDDDGTTTDTLEPLDEQDDNPLDALDRLDDIDPIAEVERLDAIDSNGSGASGTLDTADVLDEFELEEFEDEFDVTDLTTEPERPAPAAKGGGGFSFSTAPPVINEEEIKTADDIMAASQATELEIGDADGGDSELARLLAKVQARLSAYE